MLPPEADVPQGEDVGVATAQQEYEQAGELDVARQMAMVQYFRVSGVASLYRLPATLNKPGFSLPPPHPSRTVSALSR